MRGRALATRRRAGRPGGSTPRGDTQGGRAACLKDARLEARHADLILAEALDIQAVVREAVRGEEAVEVLHVQRDHVAYA